MNLKFRDEIEIAISFDNLMNEDAKCCSCIDMFSFQHRKGSCGFEFLLFLFLGKYEEEKTHFHSRFEFWECNQIFWN